LQYVIDGKIKEMIRQFAITVFMIYITVLVIGSCPAAAAAKVFIAAAAAFFNIIDG